MPRTTKQTAVSEYHCSHCERSFVRESSMLKHMCEPKRRYLDRDSAGNRIGFTAYADFYKTNYNQEKAYTDFMKSSYYASFVKFGNYCVNTAVINVKQYVQYLLENKVSIDTWNTDSVYTKYLIQYLRLEDVTDAVNRSKSNLEKLSEEYKVLPKDVLRYVSVSLLCNQIVSGKISPWLIWQTESGQEFLQKRCSTEQIEWIYSYIDPVQWQLMFTKKPECVTLVKDLIKEHKL